MPAVIDFEIEGTTLSGAPAVAVHGAIDIGAATTFAETVDAAIQESAGAFVIDLSDVDFLDSSGLNVLLRARALLGREERALAVVCPHGPVRRVFELTGVSDLFFLYGSRKEAAAALVPPE